MFEIRLSSGPAGELIVAVAGELDLAVAGQLCDIVNRTATGSTAPWIFLDLESTTLIDSSAIKEMIDAHRLAASQERVLIVRNATGVVAEVLRVAGVADALGLPRSDRGGGTVYGRSSDR